MEEKKKKFVISYKNEPVRIPFWQTITLYLLYIHYPATTTLRTMVWTILGAIAVIMWVGAIMSLATENQIDIFDPEDENDIREHR